MQWLTWLTVATLTSPISYLPQLFIPKKWGKKWADIKEVLLQLAGDSNSKEARDEIALAIASVEDGEIEDEGVIIELVSEICYSMVSLDEESLREHMSELLNALGISSELTDSMLDSAGLKLLTWCLRPMLEPILAKHGLIWDDAIPLLEAMGSAEELKAAMEEPIAFLERLAESSEHIAKKLAIMHLKPLLEPHLAKHGLEWSDVVPVLEEVDSIDELKDAVADVGSFLEKLANASGPAAKKLAIMHLKPPLEPHLAKHGLEWSDVVPVLEAIDSIDELKQAVDDPLGFLERVASASGPAAKKLAIMHLKPLLSPTLAKRGLEWADVLPVLEEVDSSAELQDAIQDPLGFLDHISKAGCQSLGLLVSPELVVLKVLCGEQADKKGVQTGDVISKAGLCELSFDGRTPMDTKMAALVSRARALGEPTIMIAFNNGKKRIEFQIKSKLTAAVTRGILSSKAILRGPAPPQLDTDQLKMTHAANKQSNSDDTKLDKDALLETARNALPVAVDKLAMRLEHSHDLSTEQYAACHEGKPGNGIDSLAMACEAEAENGHLYGQRMHTAEEEVLVNGISNISIPQSMSYPPTPGAGAGGAGGAAGATGAGGGAAAAAAAAALTAPPRNALPLAVDELTRRLEQSHDLSTAHHAACNEGKSGNGVYETFARAIV
jgi:hypothetical protein